MPCMREEKGREGYVPPRRVAWLLSGLFGIGAFLLLYLRLICAGGLPADT